MIGSSLASQPAPADVRAELDQLLARLASCGGSCPAGRTATAVKAACAAVLGSAATTIQ
jgi:hypothetical protein